MFIEKNKFLSSLKNICKVVEKFTIIYNTDITTHNSITEDTLSKVQKVRDIIQSSTENIKMLSKCIDHKDTLESLLNEHLLYYQFYNTAEYLNNNKEDNNKEDNNKEEDNYNNNITNNNSTYNINYNYNNKDNNVINRISNININDNYFYNNNEYKIREGDFSTLIEFMHKNKKVLERLRVPKILFNNNKYTNKLSMLSLPYNYGIKDVIEYYRYNDLEDMIKIQIYINMINRKENINNIIEYLVENNMKNIIKKYIFLLVDGITKKLKITLDEKYEEIIFLYRMFRFKIDGYQYRSRMATRILIGIISIKTQECNNYKDYIPGCPTCIPWIATTLPPNKRENTILICNGTKDIINENNLPYIMESRYIYSEKYIKHTNKCIITGKRCKGEPRVCYFI